MKSMETLLAQHPQWKYVVQICQQLHSQGYEAVLAGGCVRDALLGKLAKDIDIATSATPEQIEKIFAKVIMVGKSFGVCRVVVADDQDPIELATFREESDYKDGRHPETVVFSDMKKDSARRDFTVNAMFYDLGKKRVLDYVGGEADLQNKILRTVGLAEERFAEDSLRLLRAARFAAQLEFTVEEKTLLAVQKVAGQLTRVSAERRQDEFNKAFAIEKPFLFFEKLRQMKLQKVLFTTIDWNDAPLAKVFKKSCPQHWGWAALVCLESSKNYAEATRVIATFKVSKDTLSFIQLCLELQIFLKAVTTETEASSLAAFVSLLQRAQIQDVVAFLRQYLKATKEPSEGAPDGVTATLAAWDRLVSKYAPSGLPAALVVGKDLLSRGVKPGPELGQKLQKAYLLQLQNPKFTQAEIISKI
jgi:tRNA nucleotidyltransferase/poly(A) polymerase